MLSEWRILWTHTTYAHSVLAVPVQARMDRAAINEAPRSRIIGCRPRSSSMPPTPPAASRATASAPTRCPSRASATAPSRSCRRRPPDALVIPRLLEIVALVRHADRDPPDAGPGVEPGAQRPERAVVRGHRVPGEADSSTRELAALVEHGLLDHLVRPLQHRLGDREAKRLRGRAIAG